MKILLRTSRWGVVLRALKSCRPSPSHAHRGSVSGPGSICGEENPRGVWKASFFPPCRGGSPDAGVEEGGGAEPTSDGAEDWRHQQGHRVSVWVHQSSGGGDGFGGHLCPLCKSSSLWWNGPILYFFLIFLWFFFLLRIARGHWQGKKKILNY